MKIFKWFKKNRALPPPKILKKVMTKSSLYSLTFRVKTTDETFEVIAETKPIERNQTVYLGPDRSHSSVIDPDYIRLGEIYNRSEPARGVTDVKELKSSIMNLFKKEYYDPGNYTTRHEYPDMVLFTLKETGNEIAIKSSSIKSIELLSAKETSEIDTWHWDVE